VHDQNQIEHLARTYTEAWCSHDAGRVAGHYVPVWTIGADGLIVESLGHSDQAEYDRQLQHGFDPAG
jgi:hypothetical protein